MALFCIERFSSVLGKMTGLLALVPEDSGIARFPVVYLLHGYTDDHTMWQRFAPIEQWSNDLKMILILPDGGTGWYTDAAHGAAPHEQHILETVRFVDCKLPTLADCAQRGVGGLSMGGYGAIKLGLKHPRVFGSVSAHSSAADVERLKNDPTVAPLQAKVMRSVFGDRVAPAEDLFALAALPGLRPAMRIDCGSDDFLIADNRRLHARFTECGVKHDYVESAGKHDWAYWRAHVGESLTFHRCCFDAAQAKA